MLKQRGILRTLTGVGLAAMVWLGMTQTIGAIDSGDRLPHGQFLVDEATREIDQRVDALAETGFRRQALFEGLGDLLDWVEMFANAEVTQHFPLTDPRGILVTDGIADTLATRFHEVLSQYVELYPDELLTEGRQAIEIVYSEVPVPPGRFLGFHYQRMLNIYHAQAETLLTMPQIPDPEGVRDGFLRHAWDLAQLYGQVHRDAAEKYLCRIAQEDWILQRMECPRCGNLGYRYRNQRMGMSQVESEECNEILAKRGATSPEEIAARIDCYNWGHVFDVQCPQCADSLTFSVPLPYYKKLQKDMATGKATINTEELIEEY